jgi:anaerobic ribonucleoside-triphosphate reductase activating protein
VELWAHSLAYPVTALGPGRRVVLWVAGCAQRCRGCITPGLWERTAGTKTSTSAVARQILALATPLDGITITGGEPFEQPTALADLVDSLTRARPRWSVLVYSGQTLPGLRRRGRCAAALLARTDVLVAGAFRLDRPPRHPLAGSGNQRVHFLTARGRALQAAIDALPRNQVNLGLDADGGDWVIGVMDPPSRAVLHTALHAQAAPGGESR